METTTPKPNIIDPIVNAVAGLRCGTRLIYTTPDGVEQLALVLPNAGSDRGSPTAPDILAWNGTTWIHHKMVPFSLVPHVAGTSSLPQTYGQVAGIAIDESDPVAYAISCLRRCTDLTFTNKNRVPQLAIALPERASPTTLNGIVWNGTTWMEHKDLPFALVPEQPETFSWQQTYGQVYGVAGTPGAEVGGKMHAGGGPTS